MRLLLDECLPRKLRGHFAGHDAHTVPAMGWAGKRNGELLALMVANGFEAFVTADRNVRHQHNVAAAGVAVLVLVAGSTRLSDLLPVVPNALAALATIRSGDVVEVSSPTP